MTSEMRVGGLQWFVEVVFSTALSKVCKPSTRFAELWRVRFDHHNKCKRLAAVRRVRLNNRKACGKLAEVWKVRFDQ